MRLTFRYAAFFRLWICYNWNKSYTVVVTLRQQFIIIIIIIIIIIKYIP